VKAALLPPSRENYNCWLLRTCRGLFVTFGLAFFGKQDGGNSGTDYHNNYNYIGQHIWFSP